MDRPVFEPNFSVIIKQAQRVLEPIRVVSFRKILSPMGAPAFRAPDGGMKADARLGKHIVELQRFSEIRVENL